MNMRQKAEAIFLGLLILSLSSCADQGYGTSFPFRGSETGVKTSAKSDAGDSNPIVSREWRSKVSESVYRDRNGDGRIDWKKSVGAPGDDGLEIYKDDTDFDGFYDMEISAGEFAGAAQSDKKIREPVTRLPPFAKPTKVLRRSDLQ